MRHSLRAFVMLIGALGAGCGHAECERNSDCDEGLVCSLDGVCGAPVPKSTVDANGDALVDGGGQLDSGDAAVETVDAAVDAKLDGGP
jgi:hypothetical protein